jgi:uncharacterized protein (DUF1015 family)
MFIADGHHRYETACNYRDQLAAVHPLSAGRIPANFVLMMCVSMSDPGMVVLPTHRLFRGLPAIGSDQLLIDASAIAFRPERVAEGPAAASTPCGG